MQEIGIWQPDLNDFLSEHIKEDSVVLHFGTHIGYYEVIFGSRIKTGNWYAFECNPISFKIMEKNVRSLENASIFKLFDTAVYDENKMLRLYHCDKNTGSSSLNQLSGHNLSFEVKTVIPDEVLSDVKNVDLLFMDIEGAELHALEGCKELIKRSPNLIIVIEYCPSHLAQQGKDRKEFFDVFSQTFDFFEVSKKFSFWKMSKAPYLKKINSFEELEKCIIRDIVLIKKK